MAVAPTRPARRLVTLLLCAAALGAVAALPAGADTLRLKGQVGFIGEWAFVSTLDPDLKATPAVDPSYAGPLVMRHVGLCSSNGPEEQTGRMSLASFRGQRVEALRLVYGTQACVYTGPLSKEAGGFMRCVGGSEVPIRVWVDP